MNRICLLVLLLFVNPVPAFAAAIERVEPPFWWTGFKDTRLQLLVHGDGIAGYTPSVDYAGVSIEQAVRTDSPNYLFLYLRLGPQTVPGSFQITFTGPESELKLDYSLLEKNPDPAHASGFDASDAIYLITPDRFANGDRDNDNIEGMGDEADRSNPGGRHGGDIQGIIDRLGYIREMGFTAIWFNPLLENKMPSYSYHGYSTTDFYRVDPRFGSNELYRELVTAAKDQGIDVIADMIVNHVGTGHWWMDDLPANDWLNFQDDPRSTSREHITVQDPHASAADRQLFTDGWFVDTMPDLNQRNPLLADYLTQNTLWWIEYSGISGIRMDTYPYPDKHYMADWSRRVILEYPQFNMVGEVMTNNTAEIAYFQRGQVNHDGYVSWLPSLMDFPLQNALRWGLVMPEGSKLKDGRDGGLLYLYRTLADDFVYPDPKALVIFPDNHDQSRIFTQLGEDYDLFRMAMSYVLTMRGVPQLFYGSEILMRNPGTDDHGIIRSDFPGGWQSGGRNAFTGEGLTARELEAQAFLRKLLNWRRDKKVIHFGEVTHFRPENGTYVYFRHDEQESVMVVLNKNPAAVLLGTDRFSELLGGYRQAVDVISGEVLPLDETISLPARSARVLELK